MSLRLSKVKTFAFNSDKPIDFVGVFPTTLTKIARSKAVQAEINVVNAATDNLLSYKTASELGIIAIIKYLEFNQFRSRFPNLFSGKIGKLKDYKLKFHIDPYVIPTKQQHYRIPFHLREKVDAELDKLEEKGL